MAVVGGSYRKIKGIHVAANNEMGGRLVFEHLYSLDTGIFSYLLNTRKITGRLTGIMDF